MKKLSRKLIASILSMAFAVVALGTTTFAWFTANSTATASIEVNVQAGTDGILLSNDGIAFKPEVAFGLSDVELKPATYDYASARSETKITDFYKLDGGALNACTQAGTSNKLKRDSFDNAGILQFDLYINTSAASTATETKGVYFTATGNTVESDATVADNAYSLLNGFTYKKAADDLDQTFTAGTKVVVGAGNALRGMIDVWDTPKDRTTCITETKSASNPNGVIDLTFGNPARNTNVFDFNDSNALFASANDTASTADGTAYNFGNSLELDNAANSYLKASSKDPFGAGDVTTAKLPTEGITLKTGFSTLGAPIYNNPQQSDAVTKVTFTFWLEGFDGDCFDAILGQQISINLSFNTQTVA